MLLNKRLDFVLFLIASATVIFADSAASAATGNDTSWLRKPSWNQPDSAGANAPGTGNYSFRENRSNAKPMKIAPFSPDSHNISLSVGQVFLMGDLGSNYSDNLGWRVNYTYGVSDIFGFHSSFGYSNHSDGAYSMTLLTSGLRMNLAWFDKIVPNLDFGLGFYKPSIALGSQSDESISPVLFGLHLGPGVDLQLNDQVFFGTSLTFHSIFGTRKITTSGQGVEVGGTFTSFLLHAGLTL